jgi:hypothetical protein
VVEAAALLRGSVSGFFIYENRICCLRITFRAKFLLPSHQSSYMNSYTAKINQQPVLNLGSEKSHWMSPKAQIFMLFWQMNRLAWKYAPKMPTPSLSLAENQTGRQYAGTERRFVARDEMNIKKFTTAI